jgi:3-oxoacyl-[acyl-carrier-protein] synthase II
VNAVSLEIAEVAAVGSLGANWPTIWQALLRGELASSAAVNNGYPLTPGVPVSAVVGLDRHIGEDEYGPAFRLGRDVLHKFAPASDTKIRYFGATNHSESDILLHLSQEMPETRSLWRALVIDPLTEHLFPGPSAWTFSACTGGLHALFAGALDLADGKCTDAIVIGVDALSAIGIAGFWRVGATTRGVCRPLQADRDGILIGEGAAGVHLRAVSNDSKEGVRLLGMGMSCDAFHPTDPDDTGAWLEQAIRDAVQRAGCELHTIAGIVSHGTGTAKNDQVETEVYRRLWQREGIPVTSIKSAMGHTMSAAGLFNVLVATEACRSGQMPPVSRESANAMHGIDLIQGEPRPIPKGAALLAVAMGFGGNNCACVVGGAN